MTKCIACNVFGAYCSLSLLAQVDTPDMASPGAPTGKAHIAMGALVWLGPRVNIVVVRPVLLVREPLVAHFADEWLEVVLGVHRLFVPRQHLLGVGVAALFTLELFVQPHVPLDGVGVLDDIVTARLFARDRMGPVVVIDVVLKTIAVDCFKTSSILVNLKKYIFPSNGSTCM